MIIFFLFISVLFLSLLSSPQIITEFDSDITSANVPSYFIIPPLAMVFH